MTTPQTGRIVVHRTQNAWRDGGRKYKIQIDGIERGRVRRGEQVAVDVPPGRHEVRAVVDWSGSPVVPVDVAPGQVVVLQVEPAGTSRQAIDQIWGRTSYLSLRLVAGPA